jgi:hypothetical protein
MYYKVGQTTTIGATQLPYIQRSLINHHFHDKNSINPVNQHEQLAVFHHKRPSTVTSKVSSLSSSNSSNSSAIIIATLDSLWHEFLHTVDGVPDKSIIRYQPRTTTRPDFVAFDVDKYHMRCILQSANIDPDIID